MKGGSVGFFQLLNSFVGIAWIFFYVRAYRRKREWNRHRIGLPGPRRGDRTGINPRLDPLWDDELDRRRG